jgi:hypothetical protein
MELPQGYRYAWHKWTEQWQVVDSRGTIDAVLTSKAKAEEPSLDELWEAGGQSGVTVGAKPGTCDDDDEWEEEN